MSYVPMSNAFIENMPTIGTTDHTISGQMIMTNLVMSEFEIAQMDEDTLKTILLRHLTEELKKQKCVEFTKMVRNHDGMVEIRARIYAVTNDKVFILRTFNGA